MNFPILAREFLILVNKMDTLSLQVSKIIADPCIIFDDGITGKHQALSVNNKGDQIEIKQDGFYSINLSMWTNSDCYIKFSCNPKLKSRYKKFSKFDREAGIINIQTSLPFVAGTSLCIKVCSRDKVKVRNCTLTIMRTDDLSY